MMGCTPEPQPRPSYMQHARSTAFVIAGLLAFGLTGCTSSVAGDGRGDGGIVQAAATPLRDVGLLRPDVPEALKDLNYPYAPTEPRGDCAAVATEIAGMDALLGPESYQPDEESGIGTRATQAAGNYAVSTVADAAADVLPYRGWVRRLSGASKAERKAAAAYAMGEQRRTFLRGYAAGLGCAIELPAPPPERQED